MKKSLCLRVFSLPEMYAEPGMTEVTSLEADKMLDIGEAPGDNFARIF